MAIAIDIFRDCGRRVVGALADRVGKGCGKIPGPTDEHANAPPYRHADRHEAIRIIKAGSPLEACASLAWPWNVLQRSRQSPSRRRAARAEHANVPARCDGAGVVRRTSLARGSTLSAPRELQRPVRRGPQDHALSLAREAPTAPPLPPHRAWAGKSHGPRSGPSSSRGRVVLPPPRRHTGLSGRSSGRYAGVRSFGMLLWMPGLSTSNHLTGPDRRLPISPLRLGNL